MMTLLLKICCDTVSHPAAFLGTSSLETVLTKKELILPRRHNSTSGEQAVFQVHVYMGVPKATYTLVISRSQVLS